MAAGHRAWTNAGVLKVDTSKYLGSYIAIVDASAASGSVVIPELAGGIGFAVPLSQVDPDINPGRGLQTAAFYPQCTFSGTTMSWTRTAPGPGRTRPPVTVLVMKM